MSLINWSPRRSRALWLLALAFAVFPFLLRTGIDGEIVLKQAMTSVYRSWRFSQDIAQIKTGSEVIVERQKEKSFFEETFFNLVSKDFVIKTNGDLPRIRAFFHSSSILQARIQVSFPDKSEPTVWEGSRRYVNNGILFGVWLSLILWLFGRSYRSVGLATLFLSLLWYVEWNLLEMPGRVFFFFQDFAREIYSRFSFQDWTAAELGRLAELSSFLWVGVSLFVLKTFLRDFKSKHYSRLFVLSLLLEPFFVYVCSQFGAWSADASWWKVYLGSLGYRFVTIAHVAFVFLRPGTALLAEDKPSKVRRNRSIPWSLIVTPVVFLMVGGWEWLHSILTPSSGDTLLQLKVFFVGFVLSFFVSSRIFSLWLGTLVVSLVLPPTQGHWMAAAYMGMILDGLLLGWWVSPFKGQSYVLRQQLHNRTVSQQRFFVVTLLAWLGGIVFSAVGAPLPICWVAMLLGVWAYAQLTGPLATHSLESQETKT